MEKQFISIDLKSFYASVECMERGLDPLTTHLVVADPSRTEKTICLAVPPALKKYGVPGRARLFEVVEKVRCVNRKRAVALRGGSFSGASCNETELQNHPERKLDYVVAPPQMAKYMAISTKIYGMYLKYVAPEDIMAYSIDEVFIDASPYLSQMPAQEMAMRMIRDVLNATGITATAGIGTNLYLSKIAMDIEAKHSRPDANGVRIACLDEMSYREKLWEHRPITDFWRVGGGIAKKLAAKGMYTMGDVAIMSVHNEELLYRLFGVNAELLIDHAWGIEPCTMADIKAYRPQNSSICTAQVLSEAYDYDKAAIVLREMGEALALELVRKRLVCGRVSLFVGYDTENLKKRSTADGNVGEIVQDRYGRSMPKPAHGSATLDVPGSSARIITAVLDRIFSEKTDRTLSIRRLGVSAEEVAPEEKAQAVFEQMDVFTDYEEVKRKEAALAREKKAQSAVADIQRRFGKNAILRGTSFLEGATGRERGGQIGGHKA